MARRRTAPLLVPLLSTLRLALATALALALALVAPPLAALAPPERADGAVGWLYVRKFVPEAQKAEFKGFKEPRLFVYDDAGAPVKSDLPGGHFEPGQLVPVPEGWYSVEVGEFPSELNRWRYYVKAGQATVVRTGLVVLPTPPPSELGGDPFCASWRAEMQAFVWDEKGQLKLVISNSDTPVEDFGMLQLHEGRYAFGFNRLLAVHEVKADQTLSLPTAHIGPIDRNPYRISMRADDSVETPALTLCKDRPTQVLAGDYVGSYYIDTMAPPFRKRIWEEQTVAAPGGVRYKRAPKEKGPSKKVYRGDGSAPSRSVTMAVLDPLPKP